MKVINFWGAPCASKSTTAEGLSYFLKQKGHKTQLIQEVAKQATYDKHKGKLEDQFLMSAEQNHLLYSRKGQTDLVVSDSPLPLALIYTPYNYYEYYTHLVWEVFYSYENYNFFLPVRDDYDPKGRNQTREESLEIQKRVLDLLVKNKVHFWDLSKVETKERFETIYGILFPKF
jgi:AAA domain-containing protein